MTIKIVENKTQEIIESFYDMTFDPFSGFNVIHTNFEEFLPKTIDKMVNSYGENYAKYLIKERKELVEEYNNQSLRVVDKKVFMRVNDIGKQVTIEY